tara:strand:- start:103 stop:324 length:222 start_codon:yes stop_codon:yes gene_type:complete
MKYAFTYLNVLICGILISAEYDVGDQVDIDDQLQSFSVCNGDYFNNELSLADLNGDVNGGHYFVSWFDISATW